MTLPMSIIEKENILKGLSRERLTQELAQPTGNFPLFLVASRLKEVEEMEKAAQAQMAQSQNSQQAGSVYERMVTGQPEVSSQGSFAQNRPMSPGVPNVPSEIAAQPAPQPQQQPTQMPMAVAAYGGYAGNLPTMRRARGTASLDSSPITEEQIIASAQAAQEAEAGKRYGYETGRKGRDYDPFRSGLAALWAEKGRQGRELAAMGMPLTKRYGAGDSPYGTGASFVKRYANDGGYVNNLPTVRMAGEDGVLDAILSPAERYENLRTGLWDIMRPTRTEAPRFGPDIQRVLASEYDALTANRRSLLDDPSKLTTLEQRIGPTISNFSQITPPPNAATTPLPTGEIHNPSSVEPLAVPPLRPLPVMEVAEVAEVKPTNGSPVTTEEVTVGGTAEEVTVGGTAEGEATGVEDLRARMLALAEQGQGEGDGTPLYSPEAVRAGQEAMLLRRKEERDAYEAAEKARIDETTASGQTSVNAIKAAMDDVSDFAKGGKLPQELQSQYINDLLMTAGGALLGNPTWHQAGEVFINAGIEVKDKYRDDYAKSLNTLLTNETQLQTLNTTLANARADSQAALAKSMFEFSRGDEEAGVAFEKAAVDANNAARQLQVQREGVMAQRLGAMASLYTALNPDLKTSTIERGISDYYDQIWKESATDPVLREEWFFKGDDGNYSRDNYRAEPYYLKFADLVDRSAKYPGTLPPPVRREAAGWSAALSQGNTAWSVFKDGAFTGESGKRV